MIRIDKAIVTERKFGKKDSEGHFDGYLGQVQDGMYSIALTHVGILYERFDVLGYTRPYAVEGVRFAVRKGGAQDITSALMRPFKWEVSTKSQ